MLDADVVRILLLCRCKGLLNIGTIVLRFVVFNQLREGIRILGAVVKRFLVVFHYLVCFAETLQRVSIIVVEIAVHRILRFVHLVTLDTSSERGFRACKILGNKLIHATHQQIGVELLECVLSSHHVQSLHFRVNSKCLFECVESFNGSIWIQNLIVFVLLLLTIFAVRKQKFDIPLV